MFFIKYQNLPENTIKNKLKLKVFFWNQFTLTPIIILILDKEHDVSKVYL